MGVAVDGQHAIFDVILLSSHVAELADGFGDSLALELPITVLD